MAGSVSAYDTASGKRYRVRYRKPDGAQTDKRGFLTKREANLFLASVTVSKASGMYLDPSEGRKTVAALAEQWKRGRLASLKPSSQNVLETSWRVHVEPRWGTRGAASIRPSEIEDWVGELHREKSAQTVRRAVFVLSAILTIAERDKIIHSNPAKGLRLPEKRRKPQRYLTHQQVDLLAQGAGEHRTMMLLLAYTGLRWGEAIALRVRHLDMLRRRISVEENAVLVKGAFAIGTPKSGLTREVPLPAFLAPAIAKQCEGKTRSAFLFGAGGVPLPQPHRESGWFAKALSAAQAADETFPDITPHDLRHTAASLAISAGANVKAVQRMLGHASAAMTLDVYADLFDYDLEAVAAKMSEARAAAVS